MKEKILIVEDQFIEANDLKLMLEQAGYQVSGIARSVEKARELVAAERPDMVLLDIFLKGPLTGIDLAKELRELSVPFVYLSANSNQQVLEEAKATDPYGFLVKPFRPKDVLVTLDIARYRHAHSLEARLRKEAVLQEQLMRIAGTAENREQKLLNIAKALQAYLPFDFLLSGLKSEGQPLQQVKAFQRIGLEDYQVMGEQELITVSGTPQKELQQMLSTEPAETSPLIYNEAMLMRAGSQTSLRSLLTRTFRLKAHLALPVPQEQGPAFYFLAYSRLPEIYTADHLAFCERLQACLRKVVESIASSGEQATSTPEGKSVNPRTVTINPGFEGVIGHSPQLLNVLDMAKQVAPFDTSVLILGESGTGKEKIATCIHELSPRKGKPMIKVNCAALPMSLIESELFGHEKGAFTGATERRQGKFEQAHEGTIFLDEIGEVPLDVQVKLLRVLQEREIERIGGNATVKINVRVIAATNRNLEKEVAEGRFRLDLYYRLNVFPILYPPLRERREDILPLADYFAKQCFQRIQKPYQGISAAMQEEFEAYHWPGNIRELENVIEQSVILNDGKSELTLRRPLGNPLSAGGPSPLMTAPKNLSDVRDQQQQTERDYIISILKKTKGKIRGEGAAAELLNLKPTTLESRMQKLGIRKEDLL